MSPECVIKHLLGIDKKEGLNVRSFIRSWHRRLGPLFYKKKYSAHDVVRAMERAGMKRGSTVLIQSSWKEFYNCTSSPTELIDEILRSIGPEGTLCMACMPIRTKGKPMDFATGRTTAGYLAECFRKYPGVVRSINRHSVVALGPNAHYLLDEHHLGETPWDEKSPYYRLTQVDALVFGLGLGSYWMGTVAHCTESLLRNKDPFITSLWNKTKTAYHYIDIDGEEKVYQNYGMRTIRLPSYFKQRRIIRKYLTNYYQQVSNLQISCFEAKQVVSVLNDLAFQGKTTIRYPFRGVWMLKNRNKLSYSLMKGNS